MTGTALAITLLMAITTVLEIRRQREFTIGKLEERGLELSETVADIVSDAIYYADVDAIDDIADIIIVDAEVSYVRVFRSDGSFLVDTSQGDYPTGQIDIGIRLKAVSKQASVVERDGDTLKFVAPAVAGNEDLGGVVIGLSTDVLDSEIREITRSRIWQTSLLLLLALAIS